MTDTRQKDFQALRDEQRRMYGSALDTIEMVEMMTRDGFPPFFTKFMVEAAMHISGALMNTPAAGFDGHSGAVNITRKMLSSPTTLKEFEPAIAEHAIKAAEYFAEKGKYLHTLSIYHCLLDNVPPESKSIKRDDTAQAMLMAGRRLFNYDSPLHKATVYTGGAKAMAIASSKIINSDHRLTAMETTRERIKQASATKGLSGLELYELARTTADLVQYVPQNEPLYRTLQSDVATYSEALKKRNPRLAFELACYIVETPTPSGENPAASADIVALKKRWETDRGRKILLRLLPGLPKSPQWRERILTPATPQP